MVVHSGGIGSGTALIRPDFRTKKYGLTSGQQTEYVIGGGTVDFMLLAMADYLFNEKKYQIRFFILINKM